MPKSTIESLRAMVDAGRLRASATDLLTDLCVDDVRELGEKLTEFAELLDECRDGIETWQDQEDRELRAESRDEAIDAIERLCNLAEFDIGELDVPEWIKVELIRGPMSDAAEATG